MIIGRLKALQWGEPTNPVIGLANARRCPIQGHEPQQAYKSPIQSRDDCAGSHQEGFHVRPDRGTVLDLDARSQGDDVSGAAQDRAAELAAPKFISRERCPYS